MSTNFSANTSQWPLVISTFPASITQEHMVQYFDHEATLLERKQQYVEILIVPGDMESKAREYVSKHDKLHAPLTKQFVKGKAFVFHSMLGRNIFKAIGLFFPYPFAHKVFSNEEEAKVWAAEQLKA